MTTLPPIHIGGELGAVAVGATRGVDATEGCSRETHFVTEASS